MKISKEMTREQEVNIHCDAINVYRQCNLLPSELLKQRDELLEALEVARGLIDMAEDWEWHTIDTAIKHAKQ